MDRPELNPEPQRPHAGGQHVPDDDIELPPVPQSMPDTPEDGGQRRRDSLEKPKASGGQAVWAVGLLAAIAIGSWLYIGSGAAEEGHPNWPHVVAATEASASSGTPSLTKLAQGQAASSVTAIEVAEMDAENGTTQAIRAALRANSPEAASERLRAAQRGSAEIDLAPEAELMPESALATAIEDETVKFFSMDVFDCCDEDGDVVQLVVNGKPFATVPITHQGATVTVPLARGGNTLTLVGIRDGGGGITVSFRTSQGEFITKRMRVGEEHQLGVAVR